MLVLTIALAVSLAVSLCTTPLARRAGARLGALDVPDERKVHTLPVPRTGGLGIFLACLLTLSVAAAFDPDVSALFVNRSLAGMVLGALICFGIGFADDMFGVNARIKLLFQILAATVAWFGGTAITTFHLFGLTFPFLAAPVVSYLVTVFWFLLFVNAVNLIDGLDGLSGGICFFTCLVMAVLLFLQDQQGMALVFAVLSGSILGFLRYNFPPASIFLGDGGTYFLGFTIAGLAVAGSLKSQVGATILIPLLSMGVPLFDTLVAPLRRFARGRRMFEPDKDHVHHRLLARGLSSPKAVLVIYGITGLLCLAALAVVNIRDEQAGGVLALVGVAALFFLRFLGYVPAFRASRMLSWLRDVSDVTGLRKDRRIFSALQARVHSAATFDELWTALCALFESLELASARLRIVLHAPDAVPLERTWTYGAPPRPDALSIFRIDLPVAAGPDVSAVLELCRNVGQNPLTPETLARIERIRRSLLRALVSLQKKRIPL